MIKKCFLLIISCLEWYLLIRKKTFNNISHKVKSGLFFLRRLSPKATGKNIIITSMYTHEVLQNINNTSKPKFSFSTLPFKEFWEGRANQIGRSCYIILLLSQMANSVQKIKVTLFKILSLKESSKLIGQDDFWLFGKNDFWLYQIFQRAFSPHKFDISKPNITA